MKSSNRVTRHALALLIALSLSGLTACADAPERIEVTPGALARNPCRPPADLMTAPPRLPQIKPGDRLTDIIARDSAAYRSLVAAMAALQAWIAQRCG